MVRGIENGCSVVRGVYDGLSMSVDARGNIVGAEDVKASEYGAMVVHVPANGIRTLHSRVGDCFAWLCCAAACALLLRYRLCQAHAAQ